jgi:RNA polymerase sigma-70 factor (ECF subfamily)
MDQPKPTDSPKPDPDASAALTSFELIGQAKQGDRTAVNRLCLRYIPILERWTSGRLPPGARGMLETRDIVQETVIKTLDKLADFEYQREGALLAYMRTALHNRIRQEARRLQSRGEHLEIRPEIIEHGSPSPLQEIIGKDQLDRYEKALERLRPEESQSIILRLEMGLPYNEVAEALGKPTVSATRMAVSRALVRLAEVMADESW